MNRDPLDQASARRIIEQLGGSGTPPEWGLQFFTVGVEEYLQVLKDEYLETFIQSGGSAFKMVVGSYGGGKTHFLYCLRDIAWEAGYAVSYVSLRTDECPFHRLDRVYAAIARGIMPPLNREELLSGYEKGISSFIRCWAARTMCTEQASLGAQLDLEQIESISFRNAVLRALEFSREENEKFHSVCQWLLAEGYDASIHKRLGILERVDRRNAFCLMRSLAQWVRAIGYKGLVVLLDEAESTPSLSTKNRVQHLSNLRELIDQCAESRLQGFLVCYAVPDIEFIQGGTNVYVALQQRLETIFEEINPSGVKIMLEYLDEDHEDFLSRLGEKLSYVYQIAYATSLPPDKVTQTTEKVMNKALEERYAGIGYKRLFVQKLVRAFHLLRARGEVPSEDEL